MSEKIAERDAATAALGRVAVEIEYVAGGITSSSEAAGYRNGLLRAANIVRAALGRAEAVRDGALVRIAELEQSLRSESLARRVDTTLLREYERRFAEAAKLHRPFEGVHGEMVCAHRYCVDGAMDQHKWPCPTAVALGLNEGESE